jgi:hypothetical protein
MHAHFLTNDGRLWASLDPDNLLLPPAGIVLKHGGTVGGSWKVLFTVDAYPTLPSLDDWRQSCAHAMLAKRLMG